MDTIFAEATAPGRAGVAIIRMSGPQARNAAEILAGPLPQDSRTLRTLRDATGEVIDEALVLTFSAGRSFTGDDVVELHCHGSVAVLRTLLATLSTLPNLRFAEPGEFTRRALENGRLDLSQVEGLADLIDAETDLQRRQAVAVMTGALAAKVDGLRAMVIRAMALLEAAIDFVDEDVPTDVTPEVDGLLARLEAELAVEIDRSAAAERLRSGFEVAIVGAPNVGKSTLLNRLAGRRAALTSKTAGTTRDVIEVRMDLGGIPVTLIDTAGLRETDDELEKLGIDAGRERAQMATLRLHLVEADDETQPSEGVIVRRAKDDFGRNGGISGETGSGVDELISEIRNRLKLQIPSGAVAIRARHRLAMEQAKDGIERARRLLSSGGDLEICAEELRNAVRNLDGIVGKVDVESLLDEIFRSFCIGK